MIFLYINASLISAVNLTTLRTEVKVLFAINYSDCHYEESCMNPDENGMSWDDEAISHEEKRVGKYPNLNR